jgi:hypothetical protein
MIKYGLILFGIFDLLSFWRTYKIGLSMIDNLEHFPLISILEMVLILSLIVSGTLSILRNKSALIIYYFQFPLRLAFMVLTFGFLLKIFGLSYDSIMYKLILGLTYLLEVGRLGYTIVIHKRYYKK